MCFRRNSQGWLAALALAALAILLLKTVVAFERLGLHIDEIAGANWRAEQLQLDFAWQASDGAGYRLAIGRLQLPWLEQTFTDVQIECQQGIFSARRIHCDQGEVRLNHPVLDQSVVALQFDLEPATGRLTGTLDGIGIAAGRLDLELSLEANNWQLQLRAQQLNPARLALLLPAQTEPMADWTYQASIDLSAQLTGQAGKLGSAKWQAKLAGLTFADAFGTTAGEGLAGRLEGRLSRSAEHWSVNSQLTLDEGELLTPVFYLNATEHPLKLASAFTVDPSLQSLSIRHAHLQQQKLLELEAQARLQLAAEQPIQQLRLRVKPFPVADVYRELLQPVLQGTPWGRFELGGQLELEFVQKGADAKLDLSLHDLQVDDAEASGSPRRMGLYGVNGHLIWRRNGETRPSWLAWQAGHVLERIDIGPARIDFQTVGKRFKLAKQIRVPVLDGFLQVDRLDIEALGEAAQRLEFDGLLEPISMGVLSEALGWVPLSGKLSGMIPGLTFSNGVFSLAGNLLVRMFDGSILIKQLRVQDLFGIYPQLQADIALDDLDLEQLTGTFSFGKITGRLDGYVRDLRLEAWQPVTFDARFYTPSDDKSRRRISQKAVDNISNLGGAGLSGSVARSFLGMFEEFRYRRLGIGCRLAGGICDMIGVEEAKQGYYLMQGSGIPRIDIIGYNRTADWNRLVEQLKQITESGPPVIQ
jgi:hypothetical protein